MNPINKRKYKKLFPNDISKNKMSIREKALYQSLDTRKFEIELYWKRAAYFWAFLAATFAAYFVVLSKSEPPQDILFLLNCLGLMFSISWYFVNRGSKFWQENWERHVDMLEDQVIGPLYKITRNPKPLKFRYLHKEYPFSVSKVNQILNIFVIVIWIFLGVRTVFETIGLEEQFSKYSILSLSFITLCFIYIMFKYGKSSNLEKDKLHF